MYKLLLIGHIIAFSLLGSSAGAQADGGCVTAKCHATVGTKPFVHGPVGARMCVVCHNPVKDKDHTFTLAAEDDELCFGCHETKRDMMLEDYVHTPVANGNCVGCHNPHDSDYRFTLKGKASDLCFGCHDREDFNDKFVHGPVGVGDCNACHNPHASSNEFQLRESPEQLCFMCHKEQVSMMTKRHIHPPVEDKCTSCHKPHASKAQFMLPDDPPFLCYNCHTDIAEHATVTNPHPPVAQGECLKCHNPHSSDNPNMFALPQADLCFSCHTEMKEFVSDKEFKHGPVKEGDCNACHDPHGSNNHRILRKYFPEEFYKPFAEENYALCFECHNHQIANDEKTTTLTDFRNKDVNLHFVHVNKDVKGRSCRACHQVHASNQAKHIRKSVPFGNIGWELPVTYTKTENGGSCVVGCHGPKEYSRQ